MLLVETRLAHPVAAGTSHAVSCDLGQVLPRSVLILAQTLDALSFGARAAQEDQRVIIDRFYQIFRVNVQCLGYCHRFLFLPLGLHFSSERVAAFGYKNTNIDISVSDENQALKLNGRFKNEEMN